MAKKRTPFERQVKKLAHRDWRALTDSWAPHMPSCEAGSTPSGSFLDADSQRVLEKSLNSMELYEARRIELPSAVRSSIFQETLCLAQKSVHVSCVAAVDLREGNQTWAVSTAYHAAFFAFKAILGLVGIVLGEAQNKHFWLDIWPCADRVQQQGAEAVITRAHQLQHWQVWALVKRIVRCLRGDCIDQNLRASLDRIGSKEFAQQRNHIHYVNSGWVWEDLFCVLSGGAQASLAQTERRNQELEVDDRDFSIALAFLSVRALVGLLQTMNHFTHISEELALMKGNLWERGEILRDSWCCDLLAS